jgi:hypothetical protein
VCAAVHNPGQEDLDADRAGDLCDLDDGLLLLTDMGPTFIEWQDETVCDSFNLYRGDLSLLPQYTQEPTGTMADRFCGEPNSFKLGEFVPALGGAVNYQRPRSSLRTRAVAALRSQDETPSCGVKLRGQGLRRPSCPSLGCKRARARVRTLHKFIK